MQLPKKRALVLTRLVAQKIDVAEAALVLGLSERSVRRLRSLLVAEGPLILSGTSAEAATGGVRSWPRTSAERDAGGAPGRSQWLSCLRP